MNQAAVTCCFVFSAALGLVGASQSPAYGWGCELYDYGSTPLLDRWESADPACQLIFVSKGSWSGEEYDTDAMILGYQDAEGVWVEIPMTVERRLETLDVWYSGCGTDTCSYGGDAVATEYMFHVLTPAEELPANTDVTVVYPMELNPGEFQYQTLAEFSVGEAGDRCMSIENDFMPYCSGPPCSEGGCNAGSGGETESSGCQASDTPVWPVCLVVLLLLFTGCRRRVQ